ncbi:hypothetical protein [Streptomyces formicae]
MLEHERAYIAGRHHLFHARQSRGVRACCSSHADLWSADPAG